MSNQVQNQVRRNNPITTLIRSFFPSYKQDNPYVFRLTTDQKDLVSKIFKTEIGKVDRRFRFEGRAYHLTRDVAKIARNVYNYTDNNSTLLGCLSEFQKPPTSRRGTRNYDALLVVAKFLTLANSPLISWKQERRKENAVRTFFLYLATIAIKRVPFEDREALQQSFSTPNKAAEKLIRNNLRLSNDMLSNYSMYVNTILTIHEMLSQRQLSGTEKNVTLLVSIANLIKQEKAIFTNRKPSIRGFTSLDDKTYVDFSKFEVLIIDVLKRELNKIEVNSEQALGFLTESENKIWLSDEPRMTKAGIFALILNYLFMIMWAIIILYPIALLFRMTINGAATSSLATTLFEVSPDNFDFLFEKTLFFTWMGNTFAVATATALIVTLFCSLLAYAYSRFEFKGKKSSIGSVMVFQLIPAGLALIVFIVYGKYFTDELKLEGSHLLILIVIYSGGAIAGNTFLLKGYMDTISADVFDAARIDGCSNLKVFRVIAIPLAKPMMAVIFLWSFVGPFFDFLLPTILAGGLPENYTMAAGLNSLISNQTSPTFSPGAYAAGGMLVALPFAILFLSLNKQIVNGLTAGAVK